LANVLGLAVVRKTAEEEVSPRNRFLELTETISLTDFGHAESSYIPSEDQAALRQQHAAERLEECNQAWLPRPTRNGGTNLDSATYQGFSIDGHKGWRWGAPVGGPVAVFVAAVVAARLVRPAASSPFPACARRRCPAPIGVGARTAYVGVC
jgi:hypothetical protein